MLYLILSSILVTLIYIPFGVFLSKENKNITNFSSQLIYSLIVLSFIALFLNFFSPLNIYINSILIIISLILFFKDWKRYNSLYFLFFLIIISSTILLLVTNSNTYRPDAGLYHFPYTQILNEEKIIIGLSNLHFRFGHISIIQYLSAISNNIIFGVNGMIFAPAVIAAAVIVNFLFHLKHYINNKQYNFHFYYLFFTLIFIFYKMNRYSEYGNDSPAHFLFFFLISETLRFDFIDNVRKVINLFILSAFILLNKITLGIACLIPFMHVNKTNFYKCFKIKRTYFGIILIFLWFLKNVLVSGCIVYPLSQTCIKNLSWTDIHKTKEVSAENEAWTKSWSEQNKIISHNDYIKDFKWISTWRDNYLPKLIEILLPYILFTIFITIILYIHSNKNMSLKKLENSSKINFLFFLIIVSFIIWFIKIPIFRYGTSFLISMIVLMTSYICVTKINLTKDKRKFFSIIIFIGILAFITKNFYRVLDNNYYYNNSPWPKFYSHGNDNIIPEIETKIISGKKIYKATEGTCMYSRAPCTGFKIDISIKKKFRYLIFTN
tara:strand:+ start:6932 stop:8581 length:1650 start_codon:yes stop_codon:yes gene_type:complete